MLLTKNDYACSDAIDEERCSHTIDEERLCSDFIDEERLFLQMLLKENDYASGIINARGQDIDVDRISRSLSSLGSGVWCSGSGVWCLVFGV